MSEHTAGSENARKPKPLSEKSQVTLRTALITMIGSVLIAALTTFGTIFAAQSTVAEATEGADRARRRLAEVNNGISQVEAQQGKTAIPIGTIVAYAGPITDEADLKDKGWLPCDGRAVSRSEFGPLWKVLQKTWGEGDGGSTFNLPDLRGVFLRGVDPKGLNDPDAKNRVASLQKGKEVVGSIVGSYQADALVKHDHPLPRPIFVHARSFKGEEDQDKPLKDSRGNLFMDHTGDTGGAETRPKNAYVFYIIKY